MSGVTLDDETVRARLSAIPAETKAALLGAASDLADRLREAAERNLSGSVLNARSGKLRDSLSVDIVGHGGGITAKVTDTAPYAAFQEHGFSGMENVRAFLRQQTMVFGRRVPPIEVRVRAHDRRVDYVGKHYLRDALAEIAPSIRQILSDTVLEAIAS